MNTLDCCLTLMLPKSIEETLVEHLLDHPEWMRGFSTVDVSGHGAAGVAHTTAELVRGASRRVKVQIIMNRVDAAALIEHLRETLTSAEVTYWLTPVLEFGRFE
jgi:hypothetical protein